MKRSHVVQLLLAACMVATGVACAGKLNSSIPARPDKLGLEEVDLNIVKPERWVLSNGLVVLYRFDDEIPTVHGHLYLQAGQYYDSSDSVGVAGATAAQMREGGIPGYSPEKLNQHLDDLAANVEAGIDSEYSKFGFSCLSEDFPEVFDLFAKVVRYPAFDEKQLSLWKKLAAESIRRRRDDPETMAQMSFSDLVYGANTPFSRRATYESIEKISTSNLRNFHDRYVTPTGALLAISGSVPKEQLQAALEKEFGSWKSTTEPLPTLPEVSHVIAPGIYVLQRDFKQATILIGHLGPKRLTPDMFPMVIFNQIFSSGSFESQLFNEIRTRLGLVYSIDGGLMPAKVAGLFEISLASRNEEAAHAIDKTIELISASRTTTFDAEKIKRAKSSVKRRFVFNFSDTDSIVNRAAVTEILGFPKDHDYHYLERVSKVTSDDIRNVAEQRIRPQDLVVVVVGGVPAEKIAQAMKGKMNVYKLDFDTAPKVVGPVGVSPHQD